MSRTEHGPSGVSLIVEGLRKSYAGVTALDGVDFEVHPGELVGLIGPNGSGKSTAIDLISGFQKADSGSVRLGGREILGMRPYRHSATGLVRTFQGVRVFETLTVRRNLYLAYISARSGPQRYKALLRFDVRWPEVDDKIDSLMEKLNLVHRADWLAGELSYGQRKLVEFAAAILARPKIVLLDEPVAAVNPTVADAMRDLVTDLHQEGATVLLVEHNMEVVVSLCTRVVVLDRGSKIADGPPQQAMRSAAVQEAYFGK